VRAVLPASPTFTTPRLGEVPEPQPGPGEIRIAVRACGLNHVDLMQMRGFYPPPQGESPVPGMECAGIVDEVGPGIEHWRRGERVMALLAGGGQAEKVVAPEGQAMRLPESLSFVEGAALPEACLTAWTNLVAEGALEAGESVLITGATGGMGTMAVQLAHALGARVLAASRSRERLAKLAGGSLVDVLAPPWNRIAPAVVARLAGCGIRGLSRYGARRSILAAPGVVEINTHVDIVDWKGGRAFVGAEQALLQATRHLAARREGRADAAEPTGWLTHHACHDENAWAFLAELFERFRPEQGVRWKAARELFHTESNIVR